MFGFKILQTKELISLFKLPFNVLWQAWIFLFRNCTIPNHNPEMRLLFQIFFIIILVTKSHDKQTTYICMYGIYSQLVFRPFTPKRFGKTRLIFINCLKACNCCTLMDIIACFALPKTSLLFQKSSNYLYYSNPYFSRINRNIRAWLIQPLLEAKTEIREFFSYIYW